MNNRIRATRHFAIAGECAVVALLVAGGPALAGAQAAAGGAMGQGQASINVRSDVTLAIKGLRSTTSERLAQLTEVVTDQMPELRKCYRSLVAKRPTSVGALSIHITLETGKEPPVFELKETGGTEPDLTSCVKRVLEHAPLRKVGRPAAAVVTLEFENSRAKGEQEMVQRKEALERVDIHERDGGGFEASFTTTDGKVSFAVGSGSSREAVDIVLRTLRASSAGFADCRRRSEKGGLSPAGTLEVELKLDRGGKGAAKVGSSTVAHPRAVPCTEHAMRGLRFEGAPAGQRVDVRVTFGG